MKLPYKPDGTDLINRKRFSVILIRPENHENIGLVARAMKNTGFDDLRLVGLVGLKPEAYRTAVHSQDILEGARFSATLKEATRDLDLVLASTARFRKTFTILTLLEATDAIIHYPSSTRIGLLFGNERTGLTSEELGASNFVFFIPQASRQPSYNLASAVLLTLFSIFSRSSTEYVSQAPKPLPRKEQEDSIRLILKKLENKGFIHETNRVHVTGMVQDLFGRIALTEKDRRFLLALLNKAVD
jgi:TrmH family RNA methyltransferase